MNLELPDLDTRSLLNVVNENFAKASLKTYAVRMIYAGEHTMSHKEIADHFKKSTRDVNSTYCDISLTGLCLVYDSYFVHILEGSEDTIHRQIRFLFAREQAYIEQKNKELEAQMAESSEPQDPEGLAAVVDESSPKPEIQMFRRIKMLIVYHSIKTTFFNSWKSIYGKPFTLVSKLDIYAPFEQHMEQLQICLDKLTQLCQFAMADEKLSFEGLSSNDPKLVTLPEVGILDFLLNSKHILNLRDVLYMHRRVDDYFFYSEKVWPLSNHFTPRYLYKVKIDDSFVEPLPIMPWEIKEKEEEEEGEEKRSSSSSD